MENKSTKQNTKGLVRKVMNNSKEFVAKANDKALEKTEEAVTTTLEVATQWQNVAEKAIKGGLKLAANQQDIVFDILNEVKDHAKEGKKRWSKLVA